MSDFSRAWFRISQRIFWLMSVCRRLKFRLLGMAIGARTTLGSIRPNWPIQVSIGTDCQVADGVVFDYCHGVPMPGPNISVGNHCFIGRDVEFNIRRSVQLGNDCLVAVGVRFIDHDHGIATGILVRLQHGLEIPIEVGNDVWIGANAIILKGVIVGDGAVIAAGAVVVQSVPTMEIWGGVPAKKIGTRLSDG